MRVMKPLDLGLRVSSSETSRGQQMGLNLQTILITLMVFIGKTLEV